MAVEQSMKSENERKRRKRNETHNGPDGRHEIPFHYHLDDNPHPMTIGMQRNEVLVFHSSILVVMQ